MNLFTDYKKKISLLLEKISNKDLILDSNILENLTVELPPKNVASDVSCNAAMILAKLNKKSPIDLGKFLKEHLLKNFEEFNKIEVVSPGFLNISFKNKFWENFLLETIKTKSIYGASLLPKINYNIEFVSANPTGPLHVGHCRGAILGDVLSNLLKFNGHIVTKEYYVNDYGGQIHNFTLSVYHRIKEFTEGKNFPSDKDLYPGDYIKDIAQAIIKKNIISNYKDFEKIKEILSTESIKASIIMIKSNLNDLGITHDNFIYESDLVKKKLVQNTVDNLKKGNFVYEGKLDPPKGELQKNWKKRDQLLFKSTMFGDDSDRALKKSDNNWTYFASDIAYHNHKINRNFDILINILGADHAGYVKRIVSAVHALSKNKTNLICKVSQLVKLYKNGKPFKMSKRAGDYVTAEDLVNEVGKDSMRFMMLNRSNDVELDFDFEKVTEKSKENPVFYVQYAYARINSIFNLLNFSLDDDIKINKQDPELNVHEQKILKKIAEWPKCVEISTLKLEPHRIPYYLYDLVTLFHSYWNLGKENEKFRFVFKHKSLSNRRLLLLKSLSIVIKNGMFILGVSTPKKM